LQAVLEKWFGAARWSDDTGISVRLPGSALPQTAEVQAENALENQMDDLIGIMGNSNSKPGTTVPEQQHQSSSL